MKRKQLTVGFKPDGTPIKKRFSAANDRDLDCKISDYFISMQGNQKEKIKFKDWGKKWIDTYKTSVSHSTRRGYQICLNSLNKSFGSQYLDELRPVDIMSYFTRHSGWSKSQINKTKITLNALYKTGIINGYAAVNPMDAVSTSGIGKKTLERRFYTLQDYNKIIDYSYNNSNGLCVFFILKTGVRRGELMGIVPVRDFNLSAGIITINKTISESGGHVLEKDGGKTKNAKRQIPIDAETVERLKLYENATEPLFIWNRNRSPENYIKMVYNPFFGDLKKVYPNIKRLTPHELRHTYGTLLYESGTDLKTLSKIMGHGSIQITADIYVHESTDAIKKAIKYPKRVTSIK